MCVVIPTSSHGCFVHNETFEMDLVGHSMISFILYYLRLRFLL